MSAPALDRERLLADLHAAAEQIVRPYNDDRDPAQQHRAGMSRAWRVIAAAVADGEYDVATLPRAADCQAHDRSWSAPCVCGTHGAVGGA